ncbi:MAG TPA: hypothetical protein VL308_12680 [Gemmatimonadaceae bacterium]|jgi:hypothetical protein|nr:hypothetical protein [Gemmatimonadaceae bacterium]
MWSDTLLAAERSHLIRVIIWAVTSAALGTTVVTIVVGRRMSAPIALWFAIQTLVWGSVELMIAAARWSALSMRDVSGATRLDRLTWFAIGLDVGIIAVGVTAVLIAGRFARNLRAVGGGLGVVAQGLGLLVLDLTFASILARLV